MNHTLRYNEPSKHFSYVINKSLPHSAQYNYDRCQHIYLEIIFVDLAKGTEAQ